MEDTSAPKVISKIVIAIVVVVIVDLIFVNWWILRDSKSRSASESTVDTRTEETVIETQSSGLPSPTPVSAQGQEQKQTTTTVTNTVSKETVVQNANKEVFITLGSGTSSKDVYADINGTDVTVDTTKYTAIESITFESSIWVENGNGRAYAQLYNVDDKNPYIESVISNNTSTPTVKSSGNIPFPSGKRTYRVQAKTDLVEHPAHVQNARIKITLK